MAGFILIIIGATFLLKNMGLVSAEAWSIIWPAILIILGIWIVAKKKAYFICSECFGWKKTRVKNEE